MIQKEIGDEEQGDARKNTKPLGGFLRRMTTKILDKSNEEKSELDRELEKTKSAKKFRYMKPLNDELN